MAVTLDCGSPALEYLPLNIWMALDMALTDYVFFPHFHLLNRSYATKNGYAKRRQRLRTKIKRFSEYSEMCLFFIDKELLPSTRFQYFQANMHAEDLKSKFETTKGVKCNKNNGLLCNDILGILEFHLNQNDGMRFIPLFCN